MSKFFDEFRTFILRGNAVELAVGVVIGTAFNKVVDSLVKDVFMPVVGVATGGLDLSGMSARLHGNTFGWGNLVQSVLNFLVIGLCMFLVVKGMNALHHRLMVQEAAKAPDPPPAEKLLAEIRDLLRARAGADGVHPPPP